MVGRSHGIHAEPITFGFKAAGWYAELERDALRLDPASTQVISRDRHAELLTALAIFGGTLERVAVEIRHLQRTEVGEAFEPFGAGQQGSSAMPHKRNPILAERVSGMARLLRGDALVGLENMALWHERDMSHSSARPPTAWCRARPSARGAATARSATSCSPTRASPSGCRPRRSRTPWTSSTTCPASAPRTAPSASTTAAEVRGFWRSAGLAARIAGEQG